mmetsp:Transcript_35314/g.63626  ORF Transcript_35314/g.63626 Transcript_35314/m.63626 type:complete len:322 (+) Transcript_35314:47-1012(+)
MEAYHAIIQPFDDNNSISGTAVVIVTSTGNANTNAGNLFYGGSITGLEPNLSSIDVDGCTAKNGCGVHIHSGKGCEDLLAQEGHYYDADYDSNGMGDPWTTAQYSSDGEGSAVFGGFVDVGGMKVDDLVGRAFVVHAEDGSRIGCGLLQETTMNQQKATLAGFKQSGEVYTVNAGDDAICFVGHASGLSSNSLCQPDIIGNSCGVHIHSGGACDSKEVQGGHWYQSTNNGVGETGDPWKLVGYPTTDSSGDATFGDCIATGYPALDAQSKPFIVHEQNGGRAICGILESYTGEPIDNGSNLASPMVGLGSILCFVLTLWWR